MKSSLFSLIAILLLASPAVYSQESDSAASTTVKSHVERFSTPAMRAERAEAEASATLQTNPNDAEALNKRSLARMRLGNYRDAEADLRRAVTLNPNVSDYHANLGYVLWKLGLATEAVTAELTALKLDEKNYTAHYQLGRFLLRIGDPKQLTEAAAHLRKALEIDPRQTEVRFELLATYRALGDTAQALSQLDLLQDARPSDPRVTYVAALLAADRNDMNTAINGFRDALRRDPTLYGAWQDLGMSYIKLNRWKDAAETFAELAARQAESVEAAYLHALSLFNSGEVKQAELEARRALRLNAGMADAHTLLGIILASRGNQNGEASEALQQAVALDPKNFDAQFNLGRVQYVMKDYAGALRSLTAALELHPDHAQARFFLGTTLEAAGDSEAALKQYEELNRRDPQSPYGKLGLGALLVKRGKLPEAIDALRQSIELDATNFEAHLALGRALLLNEQFAAAILSLQQAVAISPERPDAHYQLGLALRRLGRTQEAAREFAIVDKLNTEFRTNAAPR
jgi:tetratricopeptide (TPR) repeat protein